MFWRCVKCKAIWSVRHEAFRQGAANQEQWWCARQMELLQCNPPILVLPCGLTWQVMLLLQATSTTTLQSLSTQQPMAQPVAYHILAPLKFSELYSHCLLKDSICFEDSANSSFTSQILQILLRDTQGNAGKPETSIQICFMTRKNPEATALSQGLLGKWLTILVILYMWLYMSIILLLQVPWTRFRYVCYTSIWTDVNIMSHNKNESPGLRIQRYNSDARNKFTCRGNHVIGSTGPSEAATTAMPSTFWAAYAWSWMKAMTKCLPILKQETDENSHDM